MFDTAGSRLSFTVTGGIAETFRVSFWVGTREHDVTGATFSAALFEAHGAEHRQVAVIPVQHDERTNAVLLSVPPLDAGHYLWELRATDAAGEETRLLYGVLTALSTGDVLEKIQAADASELRELAVQQAGGTAAALVLRWQACSAAALQAAEAARHAEAAARSAADALAAAQQAAAHAAAAHADSEEIRVVNELWQQKIERVVWCNEETGTWWVYERDTHASYRGEDGKSPYIGETGTWWVYDTEAKQFIDSGERVRGEDGRSPYINAAGNWVRWDDTARAWVDTGVRALGVDGRDGDTIVRHLVSSILDIPTSGETCNGGHLYYVPCVPTFASGHFGAFECIDWYCHDLTLTIAGKVLHFPEYVTERDFLDGINNGQDLVTAVMDADGYGLTLTARVAGRAGNNIAFAASTPYCELVCSGETLAGGAGRDGDCFEVYGWLLGADGSEGWHLMGEKNDIAAADVFGLVQLGTDARVKDGAPVGFNASNQLAVPTAEYSMPGAVRPSLATTISSGGACGVDGSGRVWVQPCAFGRYGVGKPSFNGAAEVACVGLMPDGSFGLPWATLRQPGVTKLGSEMNELNPIPYVVGVGATPDHQLANNLLFGGALQHQRPAGWTALGMDWMSGEHLEPMSYYLGLATSEQFTQSRLHGLELLPATFSLLGGVRLAPAVTATGQGVPTAAVVHSFLQANYYSKQEVYNKQETYSKQEVDGIRRSIETAAGDTYETQEHAAREHALLDASVAERIRKTASVESLEVLPQGQYNRLPKVDSKTIYFIVQE